MTRRGKPVPKKFGYSDHYGCKEHVKEQCYKIIRYPPDFKSKKKIQGHDFKPCVANQTFFKGPSLGVNANSGAKEAKRLKRGSHSEEGTSYATGMMHTTDNITRGSSAVYAESNNIGNYQSNMAGITSLLSTVASSEWIIDFGATHYNTS